MKRYSLVLITVSGSRIGIRTAIGDMDTINASGLGDGLKNVTRIARLARFVSHETILYWRLGL